MKTKSYTNILILLLVTVALLVTSCIRLSPPEKDNQGIDLVLARYEQAMEAKDPNQLSELLLYPATVNGELLFNPEEAINYYQTLFIVVEYHEFKLTDKTINVSGTTATIEGMLESEVAHSGSSIPRRDLANIVLRQVNNNWKISNISYKNN